MRKPAANLLVLLLAVLGALSMMHAQTTHSAAAAAASSADFATVTANLALPPAAFVPPLSAASADLSTAGSLALPSAMSPIIAVAPTAPLAPGPTIPARHPFFDKANLAIFASLLAARTMDPVSTWQFRRHGLHESELSDSFVDNKPLFATYSAAMVAGQISVSYAFHRLGWHKLERISAVIHTGAVTEAVIHNYRIGTRH